MKEKPNYQSLEDCYHEIERLQAENWHLRESSRKFGELAERLHSRLQAERWTAGPNQDPSQPDPDD